MVKDFDWEKPHPGGPMSVEEYMKLDEDAYNARYEYIDGVARMMSGGTREHERIAHNLYSELLQHFLSGPCSVSGENTKVLVGTKKSGKEHYLYPDATVSCNVDDRKRGNRIVRSPHIVFEVLSPSNEHIDRGAKLKIYKSCPTIYEIVLLSQFSPHVEVYYRDEEDETIWHTVVYDEDQEIVLPSMDINIAISDIYKGIDFTEPLLWEDEGE